jgi:hypothetical protein
MTTPLAVRTADRTDFKASACVDWLRVTICTVHETQFRFVKAELDRISGGNLFARPRDKRQDTGQNATVFVLTFHDDLANDLPALKDTLNELSLKFPFKAAPAISAIEVACDFRHKGQATERDAATLAMTYRLQSSLFAPDATNARQFVPTTKANRFMVAGTRLDPTLNYRIGNTCDDVSWQVYFKRTNAGQFLDPSDWRARVEVTLQGQALTDLGLKDLSDLDDFDFRKLMQYFRFRRPIDIAEMTKNKGGCLVRLDASRMCRMFRDATAERGMDSFKDVGRMGKRNCRLAKSRHLEPVSELQDAVKGAMRRLKL